MEVCHGEWRSISVLLTVSSVILLCRLLHPRHSRYRRLLLCGRLRRLLLLLLIWLHVLLRSWLVTLKHHCLIPRSLFPN